MQFRKYNTGKDKKAVHDIWKEAGWVEGDNFLPMDILIENSRTLVTDINGRPECLTVSWMGDMMYLTEKLRFSCIAGVTTSLSARKKNLAGRLTAENVALDAADGAEICALGMFDQGYYNKLGFGTGTYTKFVHISPSALNVKTSSNMAVRLERKDWKKMHQCRLKRMRLHGSCISDHPAPTRSTIEWVKSGFGYGFYNKRNELTHFIWMRGLGEEHGPLYIRLMVYQDYAQLLELLGLIKSFEEQIKMVYMVEPPNIQFQDFLNTPFQYRMITGGSKFENTIIAMAWWQARILDLGKCLGKTRLIGEEVKFNLKLSDPIDNYLGKDAPWRGIAGDFIITLGGRSSAKKGSDKTLPTMEAEIGAFTRMWLGCLSATGLAASDNLSGPPDLLKKLDNLLRLPSPNPDWTI